MTLELHIGHLSEVGVYPLHRKCKIRKCTTKLSRYNPNDYCHACMGAMKHEKSLVSKSDAGYYKK